jgi:metal-sulfur cluster biosynthetic enzyme
VIDERTVLGALAGVRDPELDEPITELGFVAAIESDGAGVRVRLRLPTYFCAPNFAYLMVADARAALLRMPGVESAAVTLEDHFAGDEIGGAASAGAGFAEAFPGQADGELDDLRGLFARKGFLSRQARLADALRRAGSGVDELAGLRVADLPDVPEAAAYLARRRELGLDASPNAPAFVRPNGAPLASGALPRQLRMARTVRVAVEGNAGLCRSLLRTRYGIPDPEEAPT